MKNAFNIKDIKFVNDFFIITIDDLQIKLPLTEVSDRLAKATSKERADYRISPSGYGIHWNMLNEDLSINGLLKAAKLSYNLQTAI